jgi:hypothetical protein
VLNKNQPLRNKAVNLRRNGYSLNDIVDRVRAPKSTVYGWIKDVEMEKPNAFLERTRRKNKRAARKAAEALKKKYEQIHMDNKECALVEWENGFKADPDFKMFILLYMAEGSRKGRGRIELTNTDPDIIRYGLKWFRLLNVHNKSIVARVAIHPNHDPEDVQSYWMGLLGLDEVRLFYASPSRGRLAGRNWVNNHGTISLVINDSYLKTRFDQWISLVRQTL